MGKISGNKERAEQVKEIMKSYADMATNVTSQINESDRPTVFWMWTDVYGTAGVKSGINDLIDLAGGINVMTQAEEDAQVMEHPVVTQETLIKLNPDRLGGLRLAPGHHPDCRERESSAEHRLLDYGQPGNGKLDKNL